MGSCGWGPGGGPGGHGGIFMLLFLAMIVALAITFFRRPHGSPRSPWSAPGSPESPLEILRRRYAAGEIDKAAFDERRRDLGV
jgi:putative membrane protein